MEMGNLKVVARASVLILLLITVAFSVHLSNSQANSESLKLELVYEIGLNPMSLNDIASLLGLNNSAVNVFSGSTSHFKACFALASPKINTAKMSIMPKVNVKCWGAFCPSLISEADLRSFFTNARNAFICAGNARLFVNIQGNQAEFRLSLKDYMFISFDKPWFTNNYTIINITRNGALKASVYFGVGKDLVLKYSMATRGSSNSINTDLSILVKTAPGNEWLVLYHHSPLYTFTLGGGVYPIAVVVYVNKTSDMQYMGETLFWWSKVLYVKDASYYETIMRMAKSMAQQWNATLKVVNNNTIVLEAKTMKKLSLPGKTVSWWKPTIYNITESEGPYSITSGYGAVQVDGQLYLVDPELAVTSPLKLVYTLNGSIAILKELSVRYTQPYLQTPGASITLIDPPLVPDILLYTLNVTGVAISGTYLLKLTNLAIQTIEPYSKADTSTPTTSLEPHTKSASIIGATQSNKPNTLLIALIIVVLGTMAVIFYSLYRSRS